MEDILTLSKVLKELRLPNKKVVLVGGVFDILHYGHIKFLEEAKKAGDILVVALEPDNKVKKTKGEGRPVNSEDIRCHMVLALKVVDMAFILPELSSDEDYLCLTKDIHPDVIAITEGDPKLEAKQKHAQAIGAQIRIVTPLVQTPSSSQLLKLLSID